MKFYRVILLTGSVVIYHSGMNNLDHIVVAADSLKQGVDYIRSCLGIEIPKGGFHRTMGTHNHLMQLGNDAYLEVITIDPEAEAPVSTAEAVGRLEAAGMTLPAGLDPDQTLKMSDAAALVAAVGLDLNAGRPQAAVFPPGLVEGLVDLLRMALTGSPGPSQ